MASELRVTTIANNAGTESVNTTFVVNGSAKAWFNLDGTDTIAFRDSFNCSSATDNGPGDYTVPFSSSFGNVNHCSTGMLNTNLSTQRSRLPCLTGPLTASQITVECCLSTDGSFVDPESLQVVIHGDPA